VIAALVLLGCGPADEPVTSGGLSLVLVSPEGVNPLVGADLLVVRVLTPDGVELVSYSGEPYAGVVAEPVQTYGMVVIQVEALVGDEVQAAGRTRPLLVQPGVDVAAELLFLPVNTPIVLDGVLSEARVDAAITTAPDGQVILLGGRAPGSGVPYDDAVWFDALGGFSEGSTFLDRGAWGLVAAPFGDGDLVLSGGVGRDGVVLDQTVWWSQDRERLVTQDYLTYPRVGHCMAQTLDEGAFTAGGNASAGEIELFRGGDGASWSWSTYEVEGAPASSITGCVGAGDGFVVTVGQTSGAWGLFDLSEAGNRDVARSYRAFPGVYPEVVGPTLVADDGLAWVFGGVDAATGLATDAVWRVLPASVNLYLEEPLADARGWPSVVAYDDATWLVAGGWSDVEKTDPNPTIELRDRESGALRLFVDVGVTEAHWAILPGGVIVGVGGVEEAGGRSSAVAVLPWL
jgi:hypothetical protein